MRSKFLEISMRRYFSGEEASKYDGFACKKPSNKKDIKVRILKSSGCSET